jgi:hypothetical protein
MNPARHNDALVDGIARVHTWQADRMPGERRRNYQLAIEVSVIRGHLRHGRLTKHQAAAELKRLGLCVNSARRILNTNNRRGYTQQARHWTPQP